METTFDELFVKSEKESEKKKAKAFGSYVFDKFISYAKKKAKKYKMKSKIRSLKKRIKDSEVLYRTSLIEPTMDSVAIRMGIRKLERELIATKELYKELYYGKVLMFFVNLFTLKKKK